MNTSRIHHTHKRRNLAKQATVLQHTGKEINIAAMEKPNAWADGSILHENTGSACMNIFANDVQILNN